MHLPHIICMGGRSIALISAVGISASDALAQTAFPQIDPGRVEERIQPDLSDRKLPSPVQIPLIEGTPSKDEPAAAEDEVTFPVKEIVVLNNTVFANDVLHREVVQAIGEEVSLADLKRAANRITALYHEQGYVFSKAYIPPQTLENNKVVIEVVEGYVGEVEYRGIEVPEFSPIHRYAKRLSQMRPVTKDALERYILLINDLGGVQAKVIAAPVANAPGNLKLVFLIEKEQHSVGASLSNRGSDALGPAQFVLHYQVNDVSGLGEESRLIHLRTPTNNELSFYSLSQTWPIGSDGLKLSYHYRRSDAEPGEDATVFDVESASDSYSVGLSYPWIRTRAETLSTAVMFDMRDSETDSFGSQIVDDHLRYIRFSGAYRRVHHEGISEADVTYSQGLGLLDSTGKNELMASRNGGSGDANKIQANLKRQQILDKDWSLTLRATGQWAIDPLLSAELFGLGGSDYGRAFDFSELTGDGGFAGSAQLTYLVPYQSESINSIATYGFLDGGYVYDELVVADSWQSLASAGIGGSLIAYDVLSAKLEVAKPLYLHGDDDRSIEAFGTAGVRFSF